MAKKKTRTSMTTKLDELCKNIIRIRDNNTCQRCGKMAYGSDAHTSHIVCKGRGASKRRFDLLNLKLLCSHCHRFWWHKEPTESGKWFAEKFPARESYLEIYRGGKPCPISDLEMEQAIEDYKQKYKELKGE